MCFAIDGQGQQRLAAALLPREQLVATPLGCLHAHNSVAVSRALESAIQVQKLLGTANTAHKDLRPSEHAKHLSQLSPL